MCFTSIFYKVSIVFLPAVERKLCGRPHNLSIALYHCHHYIDCIIVSQTQQVGNLHLLLDLYMGVRSLKILIMVLVRIQ